MSLWVAVLCYGLTAENVFKAVFAEVNRLNYYYTNYSLRPALRRLLIEVLGIKRVLSLIQKQGRFWIMHNNVLS
ncbi:MAG: hypothetical protein KBD36_03870 [Alphaproteobacteria bacterium]|jgi:hypothetical protein|nr:hypothetical protein [Alphaproteobacteria bacterium]